MKQNWTVNLERLMDDNVKIECRIIIIQLYKFCILLKCLSLIILFSIITVFVHVPISVSSKKTEVVSAWNVVCFLNLCGSVLNREGHFHLR